MTVVAAATCAVHAVAPVQRVAELPVAAARRPPGAAVALAAPRRVPVHPASGQTICDVVAPVPAAPVFFPSPRSVAATASLAAAQPLVDAEQVAFVVDLPGRPPVFPVVAAVQPGPAHCATADDCAYVAGASVTGFAASAAAFFAAFCAAVAAFAASCGAS